MNFTWKRVLVAMSVVTVMFGAAGCKKTDTGSTDTSAAASSAPAATDSAMGASGANAASGASQ